MKRLMVLLLFVCVSFKVSSQNIEYHQTYNSREQQENAHKPVAKSYRTTAYMLDYQGHLYKMPILVEITIHQNGRTTMRVSQKYIDTGFGGRWERVYSGGYVSECQSYLGSNSLESRFMYKTIIDTSTWYFDL